MPFRAGGKACSFPWLLRPGGEYGGCGVAERQPGDLGLCRQMQESINEAEHSLARGRLLAVALDALRSQRQCWDLFSKRNLPEDHRAFFARGCGWAQYSFHIRRYAASSALV